jgi:hypothetical protein
MLFKNQYFSKIFLKKKERMSVLIRQKNSNYIYILISNCPNLFKYVF